MSLEIAQSTPTAAAIARVVQAGYPLGEVVSGEFLRRSFNQVYRLTLKVFTQWETLGLALPAG